MLEKDFVLPGVMLLYSTIDTLAWLSLPEGREDVRGPDFIAWARRYRLEDAVAPCTAEELYGGRCGLLHSFSAGSRGSRRGDVRAVYYCRYGGRETLQAELDSRNEVGIAIRVEDLRAGVDQAYGEFLNDLMSHAGLKSRVVRRSGELFRMLTVL